MPQLLTSPDLGTVTVLMLLTTTLVLCTCTRHAPHWPTPQPYLVPVNPSRSRSAHRSGMSAGAATS